MGNRRGQCTEFAVIWSLDKTGDFTIGVYNAGEWKHRKEKGHAGMFQSVRWSHVNLLNLLTFKWGVELGNVVQRMRRGLLRACGDASQCRARLHKQQSAPGRNSIQPATGMNEKWRHHLGVYCVMCETQLSFLLLCPLHSNSSEISNSCWFINDGINYWQCVQSHFMIIWECREMIARDAVVA